MSYPKQPSYPIQPSASAIIQDDITQAISQNSVELCRELLNKDPLKIQLKGFNDMTPLHQSCYRGLFEVTQLLLDYKADVNARSAFGETPLLYACRRGDVRTIHLLLQCGSELDAVDKQGSGCMHYATQGGSIVAIEYLSKVAHVNFNKQNHLGETCLHISCQQRHLLLTQYLLRKFRCDPLIKNDKGKTTLHIAAQLGDAELCWRLISVATCALCHIKDNADDTALDIAKREVTDKHKLLTEQLKYYMSLDPTSHPKGPALTWNFLLLLPFTWAGIVFALCSHFNSHSGLFALLMFVALVLFVSRQSHRISHPSRWPNPIFLGGFSGGIFHCIIGAYFKLLPGLWPCPLTSLLTTFLCVLCLYYLFNLVKGDPGIVRRGKTGSDGRELTILDVALGKCHDSEFCPYTETVKPPKTKYCRICEHPVANLDHHCLFLNNCVAKLNHRSFVIFLLIVMILQVLFVIDTYLYISIAECEEVILKCLYHDQPWIFDLALLCAASFLWESTLVGAQLINIANGQTQYFKRCNKGVGRKEAFFNLVRFFLNTKPGSTEIVKEKESLLLT